MAARVPTALLPHMVKIRAHGIGLPILFPVGADGFASVSSIRLSIRFLMQEPTVAIEEEVVDPLTTGVTHTISLEWERAADGSQIWRLRLGKYRMYGLTELQMAASTEIITPRWSSTCTMQAPSPAEQNVGPNTGLERLSLNCNPIISLSLDSSGDGALRGVPLHSDLKPEVQTPLPNAASVISTKKVSSSALHPVTVHGKNVVQCLERLATMPDRKNVLKKLDYSSIKLQTVKFLPPQFDSDVLFHFPPVGDSAKHSKAKFMEGMDKQYDGHMWTKTMTTNISNKMGLSFRFSNCVGHLRCANPSCDFFARTHRTSTVNETEFEGSTTLSFLPGFPSPSGSTLVCKICKEPPTCIATCCAVIYYVHGDATMTWVETIPFFFCADDIERCVKGSRRKWVTRFSDVEGQPPIPAIWPVKIGTNLKG